jgi:hypothetical protein
MARMLLDESWFRSEEHRSTPRSGPEGGSVRRADPANTILTIRIAELHGYLVHRCENDLMSSR